MLPLTDVVLSEAPTSEVDQPGKHLINMLVAHKDDAITSTSYAKISSGSKLDSVCAITSMATVIIRRAREYGNRRSQHRSS